MDIANEYPVHAVARESAGWTIAFGVLLIILGLFALMAPLIAGVAVTVMFGWLLILGGIAHLVVSWHLRYGSFIPELLIGLAYIVLGIFLLAHPLAGLVALTAFIGSYLLIKGIFELIVIVPDTAHYRWCGCCSTRSSRFCWLCSSGCIYPTRRSGLSARWWASASCSAEFRALCWAYMPSG